MSTNRLGIFTFYEKNGIVEDYVVYLLKELKTAVSQLIFVCNGTLSESGRLRLKGLADEIIVRDNRGFDAGAFREVLMDLAEKQGLSAFDEIVLCNDTFFGPFVPFADIFVEMESRKLDFWGLSAQPDSVDFWIGSEDIVPAFIQSFFIVVNKRMLSDERFISFWKDLDVDKWNRTQVVKNYEQRFTAYFESLGYCWDVYTDNSFFEGDPKQNIFTPYLMMPYELVRYGNCPFLKKKCITGKDIAQWMEPDGGGFGKALKYVAENSAYDTSIIREYMIKNCTQELIADKLKLSHVITEHRTDVECDYGKFGIVVNVKDERQRRIVSIYLDKMSECLNVYYAGGIDSLSAKDILENMPETVEFICVLQDDLQECIEEGESSAYYLISHCGVLCDNLIYDNNYLASVGELFEQDKYLGVLRIPGLHKQEIWNLNLDKLASGWIRRSVLAGDTLYYTGMLCQEQYAEIILSNTKVSSGSITEKYRRKLFDYCEKQEKLYLYGTGGVATRTAYALQKKGIRLDGFVVSDGQNVERELMGYKVHFVSEVDFENAGVVISVEERLYQVITKVLDDKGVKNYTYSCY